MPDNAWKQLERRVCRLLGGTRSGPLGRGCSDCTAEVRFAVEIKRSARPGPPVLAQWIAQARSHAAKEHRPWLVVVGRHGSPELVAALDFGVLVELLRDAGRIPSVDAEAAS